MTETPDTVLESNQRWRDRNREKHLADARAYHHANRAALLAKKRQHRKENPEHYRRLRYKRVYGLSPDEHKQMREDQWDSCAVCFREAELVVDHDHKTGRVRALLCNACNQVLGLFEEDESRFLAAVAYLQKQAAMMKAQAVAAKAGQGGPQPGQPQGQ